MAKDLRSWIASTEKMGPSEFRRVKKQVDSKFEASALMETLERRKEYPAVLFENVLDVKGQPTSSSVIINCFASMPKIAATVDVHTDNRDQLYSEFIKRMKDSQDLVVVEPDQAPIYDYCQEGEQVNLYQLAIPHVNELDGGRYLTPLVVAKTPDQRYNLSFNRCMLIDEKHLGIYMSPRHLWQFTREAEARNEDLPIALVLGHHPALFLSGAALVGLDKDEYKTAAGLMGEPLRLVASKSFGQDLLIPADSEIVIEGKIKCLQRTVEGPIGEFTGYVGLQRISWLVEVTAILQRKDPIILQVFSAHQDNMYAHFPLQVSIFNHIKTLLPNIKDVAWVETGGPLMLVISMTKRAEGEPVRAAMAAMAMSNFIKHVIIVDDDIDVLDNHKVNWAVATRVQADRDVKILEGIQGQILDPSLNDEIRGCGMIIDATKPIGKLYPPVALPPEDIVQKIKVDEYF